MGQIDPIVRRYADTPVLRALVELVPGGMGGALNELMARRIEEIDKERLRTLFDQLACGARALTPATIASEDFLHCYFATIRAARQTKHRQKIKYFGRLLTATFESEVEPTAVDRFERYLSILEELSYEEIQLITILARHEKACTASGNPKQRVASYWDGMMAEATAALGLPRDMVESLFARLERTGLFRWMTGVWA